MKKYFKLILINAIIFILLLEIISYIYSKLNTTTVGSQTYLDYIFKNQDRFADPRSPKFIDTLYTWCTWHPKNTVFRHTSDCFDVMLKFNKMGTRGLLPNPNDSNTIFFVGDSFVEGFGLDEDSTISERIRKLTYKQVLNLGTSGDIGTTQMSLIYDEFSKYFKHKDVFVMFYLANDFTDNDINNHPKNRYRPYRIILKNDSSKIVYKGTIDSTGYSWNNFYSEIKKIHKVNDETNFMKKILRLTYSYKTIYPLYSIMKNDIFNRSNRKKLKPYELRYSENDLKIVEIDISNILKTASKNNANVYFMNLPSKSLLDLTAKSSEITEEYRILEKEFSNMIKEKGGVYLSFYEYLIRKKINLNLVFFNCDYHYSNFGESVLADFIYSQYSNN